MTDHINAEDDIIICLRSIHKSKSYIDQLQTDRIDVYEFDDVDECVEYLLTLNHEDLFVFLWLGFGWNHLIPILYDLEQVPCVYLSEPVDLKDTSQVHGVFTDAEELLKRTRTISKLRYGENEEFHADALIDLLFGTDGRKAEEVLKFCKSGRGCIMKKFCDLINQMSDSVLASTLTLDASRNAILELLTMLNEYYQKLGADRNLSKNEQNYLSSIQEVFLTAANRSILNIGAPLIQTLEYFQTFGQPPFREVFELAITYYQNIIESYDLSPNSSALVDLHRRTG
ncbi:unnamed protein product [Adineta ricciae]|uniref:Uncharacterized protein n=2 Tax=Adineta ricciae TaxID=249248 RepID=A0A815R859_ADIRI|nr:unnamed protein product [Adineta ricciae]